MKDEELFKAWKSEQYKDQSTEEKLEFVEHLHTFPKYFEKTFLAGLKAGFETCAQSRLNVTTISDCSIKDGEQLEYAKTIIKDLLDNSDEYARERAIDFLKENE